MGKAFIVREDKNYIVAYKPACMHSAPLKAGGEGTLLDFCRRMYPDTGIPQGKKSIEGGLVHRLDFETGGLVLFARNQESLHWFLRQQLEGNLIKEYSAAVSGRGVTLEGFPAPPQLSPAPFEIKSAFRAYGPGRKMVRPVLMDHIPKHKDIAFDRGAPYTTRILEWHELDIGRAELKVQLKRGFRHQIRCHLAWLGYPLIGDALYGGESVPGMNLALRASGLFFRDPESGQPLEIVLPADRNGNISGFPKQGKRNLPQE